MSSDSQIVKTTRGLTTAALARALFKAEIPEAVVRSLPAQSLYMAAKLNGLSSSAELIEAITIDQGQLMLDLDLWERDEFEEDNIWEWLGLTDTANDLDILQKVLKFTDLKLVAVLLSRHVQYVVNDEPTDAPPDVGFYTPDRGNSWIKIETGDESKDFQLARLLAMIFETSTELYYQLLSISSTTTQTMLIEESYQDRGRRLSGQAIPNLEVAFELNAPLSVAEARRELAAAKKHPIVTDVPIVEPLIFDPSVLEPFQSVFGNLGRREDLEAELTLVINAAIVHHSIPFYDQEEVARLAAGVRGSINIGLELLTESGVTDLTQAMECLSVTKLYRLGKGPLRELHQIAKKIKDDSIKAIVEDNALFLTLAGAKESFSAAPNCFDRAGNIVHDEEGKLAKGYRAYEHLDELRRATERLSRIG